MYSFAVTLFRFQMNSIEIQMFINVFMTHSLVTNNKYFNHALSFNCRLNGPFDLNFNCIQQTIAQMWLKGKNQSNYIVSNELKIVGNFV